LPISQLESVVSLSVRDRSSSATGDLVAGLRSAKLAGHSTDPFGFTTDDHREREIMSEAPSSSGLGRRPLKAVARVRIPSGLLPGEASAQLSGRLTCFRATRPRFRATRPEPLPGLAAPGSSALRVHPRKAAVDPPSGISGRPSLRWSQLRMRLGTT